MTNIVLVVLGIIVLCVCVFLIMNTKGEDGSSITILRDMNDETRMIGDKTDVYNNEDGTVLIKGDKPTNYMEPSDLFKDKGTPDVFENDNGRYESVFVGNPNVGELEEAEEEIIEEEVIEEFVVDTSITLEEALLVLRNTRNKGSILISRGITLHDPDWQSVYFSTVASENGLIFIPFNLSNEEQLENLEKWSDVYDTYSGDINIIFLNTSYFIVDSQEKVLAEFENRGINTDIPVYYDMENEIVNAMKTDDINNVGYCVMNRDSFIYKIELLGSEVSEIRSDIVELNKIMNEYIEQENLIIQKHGEGLIRKYEDVQKALDGTLEEVVVETEIEE